MHLMVACDCAYTGNLDGRMRPVRRRFRVVAAAQAASSPLDAPAPDAFAMLT
ncbi:hypothetical protein [Falsiroseomonas tokyonensis]|uniref:Uncharacterized protein n=1 Tax=Falsiroseomonas tokyonensis TaxID=430521 RepID=A0ABV7BZV9_9PROT|nr:hypothetical protein [Falsiroseomonas tokyonensis]MBU8539464.1 hypothetical protein [Falsiroseomonas tokyonensis]